MRHIRQPKLNGEVDPSTKFLQIDSHGQICQLPPPVLRGMEVIVVEHGKESISKLDYIQVSFDTR
jgi:hypothetical protein